MNQSLEFGRKIGLAYDALLKPVCREWNLSRTALDILLFLANNPEYTTARDVVEIRCIKANLVSVNVERLVQDGYLERHPVAGDRRKTQLVCTDRAQAVIARGQAMQWQFLELLFADIDPEQRRAFEQVMVGVSHNLDCMMKGE